MFEGTNKLVLCNEAACKMFSIFLADKFGVPIEVKSVCVDYGTGITVEFEEKGDVNGNSGGQCP